MNKLCIIIKTIKNTEFYRYSGKKAPHGVPDSSLDEDAPPPATLEDGHSYYVMKGYYIPCYVPTKYSNGNIVDPDAEEEQARFAMAEAMTTRYFTTVERSTHINRSYARIQELKKHYEEQIAGSYDKQRWGALYVGALVMRTHALSDAILHGKGQEALHHEKDAPKAEDEIQEHFITFMTNLERCPEVNLQGNRPDLDKVIPEMLSEVAKAAAKKEGRFVVSFKMLHENHVIKIGGAMEAIDAMQKQIEKLTNTLGTQEGMTLRREMQDYIDLACQRAGIRSIDDGHFEESEVQYKVARDHVDETLKRLQAKSRWQPGGQRQIALIQEGRMVVDDLSYYRNPMPNTLAQYADKVAAHMQQKSRASASAAR